MIGWTQDEVYILLIFFYVVSSFLKFDLNSTFRIFKIILEFQIKIYFLNCITFQLQIKYESNLLSTQKV